MTKVAINSLLEQTKQVDAVLKTINFTATDGEHYEADVYVRKMRFADNANLASVYTIESVDENGEPTYSTDNAKLQAARILSCACTDVQGTPLFETLDQVMNADHELATAIFVACDEVNNFLGKYLKSAKKTNSGTNSSSTASVGKPSSKRKKKSAKKNSTDGGPIDENTAVSTLADE